MTIAIDGPSGSGKSSVSREVATRLGLRYLDTGAMYRALTWAALQDGIDLADRAAVAEHGAGLDLHMVTDPVTPTVRVGSTDLSRAIREPRISAAVSAVATNLEVRADMRHRQRSLIAAARQEGAGIVVEGRDITTVVAPDAEQRILLSASEQTRLARRAQELAQDSVHQSEDATRDQVLRRDRDDATVSAFYQPADGVVGIDTSHLTFDQVVDAVLQVAHPATHDIPDAPLNEGAR
ncbi:MAG: (d)CMP kinase [Ornithinimicrobium sp.]|jgi:cytidylate kinase|uniref:(d)CMP kinase n=1 Tax=Ornithinimicrobium sp. TaxID=1977084 RepID=UPI001806A337|nr:(d)CMP kinase [Actinomycetota bacterium]